MTRPPPNEFDEVLSRLRAWREDAIALLRSPETHEQGLRLKRQIESAVAALEFVQRHQIPRDCRVTVLPEPQTRSPSSNYRILEDHESDDPQYWAELVVDGERLHLFAGDIILH